MNPTAIQKAYQEGLRCKNFVVPTTNGTADVNLNFSGFAKTFLGCIALPGAPAGTVVDLIINNDLVIEAANLDFFENDPANPRQYFDFVRPLTGSDTVTLRVTSTGSGNFNFLVYFQNKAIS